MTIESLQFIEDQLSGAGIGYEFGRWSSDVIPDPYWVGEYTETVPLTEDGLHESTMILTGTGTSWLGLENDKAKIEKTFGKTAILPGGTGLAVFYSGGFIIPTGDAALKRIQINLSVKEWRVN